MSVLVSINCITYNHEKYIAQAIESFLMQRTNFAYEVLIYDDASTDRTADIIREYENKYPDVIKPFYQTENQYSKGIRVGAAFNWPRAQGKYIALCEGDDYWTDPLKLQKQVDYMEALPGCSMCFHATELVKEDTSALGNKMRPYHCDSISSPEDIILGGGAFCHTSSVMFLKSITDHPPRFYMEAPVGDYALRLMCICHGLCFYIDEVMSAYRQFIPGSWTERVQNNREQNMLFQLQTIQMLKSFNEYSQGRFAAVVHCQIGKHEREVLFLQEDRNCLKDPDYKGIFKRLSFADKCQFVSKLYLPGFYKIIAGIKHGTSAP